MQAQQRLSCRSVQKPILGSFSCRVLSHAWLVCKARSLDLQSPLIKEILKPPGEADLRDTQGAYKGDAEAAAFPSGVGVGDIRLGGFS